jgi:hypothetical protein
LALERLDFWKAAFPPFEHQLSKHNRVLIQKSGKSEYEINFDFLNFCQTEKAAIL